MGKRKHFTRQTTFHIASIVGSLTGVVDPAVRWVPSIIQGDTNAIQVMFKEILANYTGYDMFTNSWQPQELMHGLVPMIVGNGVSILASKLGVNRRLANSGVPFIRI